MQRSRGTERGTGRIEAFSDAVFAIAITLLVLELRLPEGAGSDARAMMQAIIGLWPSYFAYVLSFTMIGIYWANHHYLFKLFARTDHGLNLLNLLLLMFIAFLPFPTHDLGSHWTEENARAVVTPFYALGLLLPAIAWLLMWLYAGHARRLVHEQLDDRFIRRPTLQFVVTVALYTGGAGVALIDYRWGLAMCTGLTMLYLLHPPTGPAPPRPPKLEA